jgi:hypothetical protein
VLLFSQFKGALTILEDFLEALTLPSDAPWLGGGSAGGAAAAPAPGSSAAATAAASSSSGAAAGSALSSSSQLAPPPSSARASPTPPAWFRPGRRLQFPRHQIGHLIAKAQERRGLKPHEQRVVCDHAVEQLHISTGEFLRLAQEPL